MAGNTLRICYGCDHLLEIETRTIFLWLRSKPGHLLCYGFDPKSQPWSKPWDDFDDQVSTRVMIATLNRNPELTLIKLGVFVSIETSLVSGLGRFTIFNLDKFCVQHSYLQRSKSSKCTLDLPIPRENLCIDLCNMRPLFPIC